MLHARKDYMPIQDPREGGIPHDEPVMLFRAQDVHFVEILKKYKELLEIDGADLDIIQAVENQIKRGEKWNFKKAPDIPLGSVLPLGY